MTEPPQQPPPEPELVVMQPRCIFCKLEHYILNVPYVSRGTSCCHNCGKVPPVFNTLDEYHGALWDGAW